MAKEKNTWFWLRLCAYPLPSGRARSIIKQPAWSLRPAARYTILRWIYCVPGAVTANAGTAGS